MNITQRNILIIVIIIILLLFIFYFLSRPTQKIETTKLDDLIFKREILLKEYLILLNNSDNTCIGQLRERLLNIQEDIAKQLSDDPTELTISLQNEIKFMERYMKESINSDDIINLSRKTASLFKKNKTVTSWSDLIKAEIDQMDNIKNKHCSTNIMVLDTKILPNIKLFLREIR